MKTMQRTESVRVNRRMSDSPQAVDALVSGKTGQGMQDSLLMETLRFAFGLGLFERKDRTVECAALGVRFEYGPPENPIPKIDTGHVKYPTRDLMQFAAHVAGRYGII